MREGPGAVAPRGRAQCKDARHELRGEHVLARVGADLVHAGQERAVVPSELRPRNSLARATRGPRTPRD